MELHLVHERLSLLNLRWDIDLASVQGGVRSKLRVLANLVRLWRDARRILREWERMRKKLSEHVHRLRKVAEESDLPGAEDRRAEAIRMLRDFATELMGDLNLRNELISQRRKVRNRFRYRRQTVFYWLANRILRLNIKVHEGFIGQRRDVVIFLSELDPPKKAYPSVPALMKSMAKAV